jgi:hypothetical protein
MWGNARGWLISAVLVLAWGLVIAHLTRNSGASPAAGLGRDPAAMAAMVIVPDPATLVPMNEPGSAADLCLKAVELYHGNDALYYHFNQLRNPTDDDISRLDALPPLLEATHKPPAPLFAPAPAAVVTYGETPELDALAEMGAVLNRIGLFKKAHDPDTARRYFLAAFSLGARLAEERLTLHEYRIGATLMSDAAVELAEIDPAGADKWNRQSDGLATLTRRAIDVAAQISTLNRQSIGIYAGDVMAFAASSGERMWRVEALLTMGRMQYDIGAGRLGDQTAARARIHQYINDPDPAVATAARAAQDLTLDGYRQIRP